MQFQQWALRPGLLLFQLALPWVMIRGAGLEGPSWQARFDDFAKDERLAVLQRLAEETVTEALGGIRSALGLEPGRLQIRWILDLSSRAEPVAPEEPFESGRTHVGERDVEVILPARKFLWDPPRARPVVIHEAVHAVMASATGSRGAYQSIPKWLREGLALHIADEGELLLAETLAYTMFQGQPASAFFKGVRAQAVSYSEAYLAVLELQRKLGHDGLKAFVRDVVAGEGVERLLEKYLGVRLEAFEAQVVTYGQERVRGLLGEGTEPAFRAAMEARVQGEKARAREAFLDLLARQGEGPLSSTLRYLLARDVLESDRTISAASTMLLPLQQLLDSPATLWRPEALVLLGDCHRRMGATAKARQAFEQVLEVFGEDKGPAEEARRNLKALR